MMKNGAAFSLITQEDLPMLRVIERMLGYRLERKEALQNQTA